MTQVLLILSDDNPLQQASRLLPNVPPLYLPPPPPPTPPFFQFFSSENRDVTIMADWVLKNLQQTKYDFPPAPQLTELRPLVKNLMSKK